MGEKRKPGYWAVIPASVRYDPELPDKAKLLYGELQALADSTGFCWATNEYFAQLYGVSVRTVQRLLADLTKKQHIFLEVVRDEETREVLERRIRVTRTWLDPDLPTAGMTEEDGEGPDNFVMTPPDKNVTTPPDKFVTENNTREEQGIPPKAPQGGRRRKAPRDAPDWKPERFAGFWAFYPRGENKQRAMDAWDKLQPDDDLIAVIGRALVVLKDTEDWQRGVGIPHAATFLNNARWTDAEKLLPQGTSPQEPAGWAPDPEVIP